MLPAITVKTLLTRWNFAKSESEVKATSQVMSHPPSYNYQWGGKKSRKMPETGSLHTVTLFSDVAIAILIPHLLRVVFKIYKSETLEVVTKNLHFSKAIKHINVVVDKHAL